MNRVWLTLLVVLSVALVACPAPEEVEPPETNTVTDVLAEEGFTTLVTAIEAAGLTETLSGAGPFTLFAPTNEAFEALGSVYDELLADPDALAEVLEYHVLNTEVASDALAAEPGFQTTLQGSPLAVTTEGEGDAAEVILNGVSTITDPDIDTDNGVIHAVDTVLTPPETEFAAELVGANEVPPVQSDATGTVTATLDGTTLNVEGSYQDLVVAGPGAHIHGPAGVEANADVLFPLTFDNETGTVSGTVDLATAENGPAAFGYLQSGLLYVNLHTEENPSGEIRGQLLPAEEAPIADADFTAVLSGEEEVPEVATDAQGTASAFLDEAGTTLTLEGTYEDLSSDLMPVEGSAAHIHEAPYNQNGPIVVPLTITPDEVEPSSGTFSGTVEVGEGEGQLSLETLQDNGYYINVHTENNPSGEIRGQITQVPTDEEPTPGQ